MSITEKNRQVASRSQGSIAKGGERSDQLIELKIAERVLARFGRILVTTAEREGTLGQDGAISGKEHGDRSSRQASELGSASSPRTVFGPPALLGQGRARVDTRGSWPSTHRVQQPEG